MDIGKRSQLLRHTPSKIRRAAKLARESADGTTPNKEDEGSYQDIEQGKDQFDRQAPFEIRGAAELGQTSADLNNPSRDDEGEDKDIEASQDQWVNSTTKRLLGPQLDKILSPCTIYEVPAHIRSCSPGAYEPKVVPIGPFHHKKWESKPTVGKLKCASARHLIARHRRRHPNVTDASLIERCLKAMKALVFRARSCYSVQFSMDDHDFAELMFFDGCSILHLLLNQVQNTSADDKEEEDEEEEGDGTDELVMGGNLWIWSLVEYDLLLLENQIPFFVVRRLFKLLRTSDDSKVSLVDLALKLFSNLCPRRSANHPPIHEENVHHLLHLFYLSLLPPKSQCDSVSPTSDPEWIPCASELRENGVTFVKKTNEGGSFLDVTYKGGKVEIPPLQLSDYSEPLFRNLVAFEQCYPDTEAHVTLYAMFMDLLLNSTADARLLQRKGILVNRMAADKDGSEFFGRVCEQAHYASDANYLRSVFVEVNKRYQSKRLEWQAQFVRDNCSNPMKIAAIIVATVLLLLTGAQTFFTIFPYYHPRK